jgi:hypothetical protein
MSTNGSRPRATSRTVRMHVAIDESALEPELVSVLVKLPVALKQRVVEVAAETKTNINDVAVGALAGFYGVRFVGSGRFSRADEHVEAVVLRMPMMLKTQLQVDALKDGTNLSFTVRLALSIAFEVELESGVVISRSPFGGGSGRRRMHATVSPSSVSM